MKKKKLLLKEFHEIFCYKNPMCKRLSNFSDMQNDALMHHEVNIKEQWVSECDCTKIDSKHSPHTLSMLKLF